MRPSKLFSSMRTQECWLLNTIQGSKTFDDCTVRSYYRPKHVSNINET